MGSFEKWHPVEEFENETIQDASRQTLDSIKDLEGSCTDWPDGFLQTVSHLSVAAAEMLEFANTDIFTNHKMEQLEDLINQITGVTFDSAPSPAPAGPPDDSAHELQVPAGGPPDDAAAPPVNTNSGAMVKWTAAGSESVQMPGSRPAPHLFFPAYSESAADPASHKGSKPLRPKKASSRLPAQVNAKGVKIYAKTGKNKFPSQRMALSSPDTNALPDEVRATVGNNEIKCSPNLRISSK
ncbi:hypothetical protein ACE41H_23350 [Paenibacillus enshidis]|uniref:Uncharacterized protein n=1 Tax=Paenibacillus enshidis TaxID=1458439 RepID=A0ABV5B0F9_9BACL